MISSIHHICMCLIVFGEKKNRWNLISRCICQAFWDTRTPGGSCLHTTKKTSESLHWNLVKRRADRRAGPPACDGKWMVDREGQQGSCVMADWQRMRIGCFFISPVFCKGNIWHNRGQCHQDRQSSHDNMNSFFPVFLSCVKLLGSSLWAGPRYPSRETCRRIRPSIPWEIFCSSLVFHFHIAFQIFHFCAVV